MDGRYWIDPDTLCINSRYRCNTKGRPQMRWNNRITYVSHLSYMLFYGEIPEGKQINHHCDNGTCFNPLHIYAGTQQDNSDDAVRRGRLRGRNLQEDDVRSIRAMHSSGRYTMKSIADMYGCDPSHISRVVRRQVRQAVA